MPPTRKIRRVSGGPRPDGDSAVTTAETADDERIVEGPEISGLVPPEVVSRIHASERRVDELGRRFKQVSDDAARAIGKAIQLTDELETLKNETLENMQVAFDENAEILEAIEHDVTALKERLGSIGNDQADQALAALETRIRDLDEARATLIQDVLSIKGETESLRTAVQSAAIDEKVSQALQPMQQQIEATRREIETSFESARKNVEQSAGTVHDVAETISALEVLGFDGGSLASALTMMSSRHKTDLDEMEKKLQAVQTQVSGELNGEVKQLAEKLEAEVAKSRDAVQRVEEVLQAADGAVERSQAADRQIESLEGKLGTLLDKFEENASLVQLSRERIDVTTRLVEEAESKIRRLIMPVDDLIDQIDTFESYSTDGQLGFDLADLLQVMIKHQASDLHIKVGSPPTVRLDGELIPVGNDVLTEDDCKRLVFGAITAGQRRRLMQRKELDFAYSTPEARFRINAFLQQGTVSAAFRMLRTEMPTVEELNLPPVLKQLASLHSGLILVTGPAGSGKSTTLAAMINHINNNLKKHVITIEDPIEFVHTDSQSIITQREIGSDTPSFAEALRQALRQDPNVVLIGEMRDPETIMTAAVAAETGHLVLSTMHTQNTAQAIDRVIDIFSGDQQRQFRLLLANTLRGIVSQRLLQRADQQGRVPAVEVLIATPTISSLILEGKTNEIYPYLQQGATDGMQTFTVSLSRLYEQGLITKEEAMYHADQPTEFRLEVEGHTTGTSQYAEGEGDTLMNWL